LFCSPDIPVWGSDILVWGGGFIFYYAGRNACATTSFLFSGTMDINVVLVAQTFLSGARVGLFFITQARMPAPPTSFSVFGGPDIPVCDQGGSIFYYAGKNACATTSFSVFSGPDIPVWGSGFSFYYAGRNACATDPLSVFRHSGY
jgi:hypothetical protein